MAATHGLGIRTRASVVRIVDGDTMVVSLHWPVTLRLLDCWAPERRAAGGKEAKKHLETLAPQGSEVIVDVRTDEAKVVGDVLTFGRVLATVYRPGDEDSLNELMILDGHATRTRYG